MLKFIKHHMASIDGIEIYPIISMAIFVLFFVLMGFWIFRMKREEVDTIKNIPLED